MKLITQTTAGKIVMAYLVYRPDNTLVGKIHAHLSNRCFQVDVYDGSGAVVFQNRVKTPDLATVIGSTGEETGAVIDGVELYRNVVRIRKDDPTIIRGREDKYYLPGLDRLKAMGYKVMKVI